MSEDRRVCYSARDKLRWVGPGGWVAASKPCCLSAFLPEYLTLPDSTPQAAMEVSLPFYGVYESDEFMMTLTRRDRIIPTLRTGQAPGPPRGD